MSTPTSPPAAAMIRTDRVRTALRFYRVMAVVAGIALFVLLAAVFVHYVYPRSATFSDVWSPIHGLLYFLYAVSIVNLGFAARWPLTRMVANMLTGFVPFLPFVAERRVTRSTEELLARADTLST